MRPMSGAFCSVCGERLLSPFAVSDASGEPKCGLCRKLQPPFARATAYGSYDGALRGLIHLLKYEQVRPAAAVLGRMLAAVIEAEAEALPAERAVVVPVPLHRRKLRQRGFNQSELIARAALKLRPGGRGWSINAGLLERRRETQSQIGLTRHQRRENMRGAFVAPWPQEIEGREVLLVDDVFTTGTTVSECARVLRRAGASKVWVATVARTLKAGVTEIGLLQTQQDEKRRMAAAG